jgi:hypothetical protein
MTALHEDGKVARWDVENARELRQLRPPVATRGRLHALAPNHKTWASVVEDQRNNITNILLFDAATGKEGRVLAGDAWWIGALGFSPDSNTLYSWSGDRKVRFWSVATGKKVREFIAADGQKVYTGCFSPDGRWFACAGREKVLLLYDVATGTAARRIQLAELSGDWPSFAYTADSRTLAVGDDEGNIHLVELANGRLRRRLSGGHCNRISALVFTRDGRRLVSGSTDTTALVWDLTRQIGAHREPLSAVDLDACWTALAGDDAKAAYRAIHRLAASPKAMVPYLEKRLKPAESADPERVARLIRDLDSDQFAVREPSFRELEKLGESAIPACRRALAAAPSAEQRRRLEMLLQRQEQERLAPPPARLQVLRALEAVELAATPRGQQLLEKLAGGAPEALLTHESAAALQRLK